MSNAATITPGRLIVFEGADATGKSTISSNLAQSLSKAGVTTEGLAFPGNQPGTLGKLIYDVHHTPGNFEIDCLTPECLQILHVAAHIDAISSRILPLIKDGVWVILDRYWWSTWVYGIAKGGDPKMMEAMINLELIAWKQTQPDAIILAESKAPLRDDEEDTSAWQNISDLYDRLAENEKNIYRIFRITADNQIEIAMQNIIKKIRSTPIKKRIGTAAFRAPKI